MSFKDWLRTRGLWPRLIAYLISVFVAWSLIRLAFGQPFNRRWVVDFGNVAAVMILYTLLFQLFIATKRRRDKRKPRPSR